MPYLLIDEYCKRNKYSNDELIQRIQSGELNTYQLLQNGEYKIIDIYKKQWKYIEPLYLKFTALNISDYGNNVVLFNKKMLDDFIFIFFDNVSNRYDGNDFIREKILNNTEYIYFTKNYKSIKFLNDNKIFVYLKPKRKGELLIDTLKCNIADINFDKLCEQIDSSTLVDTGYQFYKSGIELKIQEIFESIIIIKYLYFLRDNTSFNIGTIKDVYLNIIKYVLLECKIESKNRIKAEEFLYNTIINYCANFNINSIKDRIDCNNINSIDLDLNNILNHYEELFKTCIMDSFIKILNDIKIIQNNCNKRCSIFRAREESDDYGNIKLVIELIIQNFDIQDEQMKSFFMNSLICSDYYSIYNGENRIKTLEELDRVQLEKIQIESESLLSNSESIYIYEDYQLLTSNDNPCGFLIKLYRQIRSSIRDNKQQYIYDILGYSDKILERENQISFYIKYLEHLSDSMQSIYLQIFPNCNAKDNDTIKVLATNFMSKLKSFAESNKLPYISPSIFRLSGRKTHLNYNKIRDELNRQLKELNICTMQKQTN